MNIAARASTANFVWEALADPTRRAILERLSGGEARVTDLAAPFDISLNSVSKHIRVLEKAKLIDRRRAGREHFIRFNPRPLAAARTWIERQERFWQGQLEALDRFLEGEDAADLAPPEVARSSGPRRGPLRKPDSRKNRALERKRRTRRSTT